LKFDTMRMIDLWAGKPACALLSLWRLLEGLFKKPDSDPGPVRKILFIKLAEQGATVLAWPAIKRAVEMVGRRNVYFLVFSENREIVDILDLMPKENVLAVTSGNFIGFAPELLKVLGRIRRLRIDACIDYEFFSRISAILTFLSGARRRVGLHRFNSEGPYRGDLFTHRLQFNPYLHAAETFYLMIEALEAEPDQKPMLKKARPSLEFAPPLVPAEQETRRVQKMLEEAAGQPVSRPIIVLNPNASDMLPLRKWPRERFVELGGLILEHYPEAYLVITGTKAERPAASEVAAEIGSARAINLAGRTSLRDLLTLFSLADVLVTNDSGPSHFAALTGIHNIALFGPETPVFFGPRGGRARLISAGLACSPCVSVLNQRKSPCRDNVCMRQITTAMVFQAIREILSPDSKQLI